MQRLSRDLLMWILLNGLHFKPETRKELLLYLIKFEISYVAVPRKQLDWDFGTNMLLKINLGIVFRLTMAPNIP